MTAIPLIAHVIHRLDVGGMENGLVNLINHMSPGKYRHAVVSLTESTSFRERILRDDVEFYSLHKAPGHDLGLYVRLWRLMKRLRPTIVHTRNLAAVEALVPAALAGVPCRIHGEHGRDLQDVDGTNWKYRLLRRAIAPLVHRFIALSQDLESYLVNAIGVAPANISRIINGVDIERFRPDDGTARTRFEPIPSGSFAIGTVTRMQEIKDPLALVRAFAKLDAPETFLVMVGDGPLLGTVRREIREAGLERRAWLPGSRDDVDELYRAFDVFALSSRVEGISNTVLEAMASGLPVVATPVGGNAELVVDGETGTLVPADGLAGALASYVDDVESARAHGRAGRRRAEESFDIHAMVACYEAVYDEVLANRVSGVTERSTTPCAG